MSLLKYIYGTQEHALYSEVKHLYLKKCRKSCVLNKDEYGSTYHCIPENNNELKTKLYYKACNLLRINEDLCENMYDEKVYSDLQSSTINKAENEFVKSHFKIYQKKF